MVRTTYHCWRMEVLTWMLSKSDYRSLMLNEFSFYDMLYILGSVKSTYLNYLALTPGLFGISSKLWTKRSPITRIPQISPSVGQKRWVFLIVNSLSFPAHPS